jgi:hypothetical protein
VIVLATTGLVVAVDPVLGFVGALLLLAAVREGLFPTRFRLTQEGITIDNPLLTRETSWDRFGGWQQHGLDFHLRGRGRSPILQRRHSLILRHPRLSTEVEAVLRARLGDPGAA